MIASKFDPRIFFEQAENVALRVAAGELFGWLNRTLDLPAQWAALVTNTSGDRTMIRAGERVEGKNAEELLFVRTAPVEVVIDAGTMPSRDGLACQAEVRLFVAIVAEPSDVTSFANTVLGSRRVAQAGGVGAHLQATVRGAMAAEAARLDASELVSGAAGVAISAALAEALKRPCFAAGLALHREPCTHWDSPAYHELARVNERAAVRRAEHASARELDEVITQARNDRLDQAAGLLTRLKKLTAESPGAGLVDLIRTFADEDRGRVYEAVFSADRGALRTRWIVAAAGEEVLFFDASSPSSPTHRVRVGATAGPLRSAQVGVDEDGSPLLLLGAATGVYLLPTQPGRPYRTLTVLGAPPVRGGFNAVAQMGTNLFASHSELGLYQWDTAANGPPRRRLEAITNDAEVVRCVQALGDNVYVAVDDRIMRLAVCGREVPGAVYSGSRSMITALCASSDGVFAGNSEGDVLRWLSEGNRDPEVLHHGLRRPVESVFLAHSHGLRRLIFTDTSSQVHAMVLGDSFVCRYEAGGQTLRRVKVGSDLLVAVNELRDRLFCWHPAHPQQPRFTVPVSSLCGRSVQDVCLVPDEASPAAQAS